MLNILHSPKQSRRTAWRTSSRLHSSGRTRTNPSNLEALSRAALASPWIITQGPMHPRFFGEDTTGSFWEMVFEHRVKAVVNLARCETGFGGCARYWPVHDDEFDRGGGGILIEGKPVALPHLLQ